ncbi:MAG: hypothetical protein MEQ84_03380 [Mesorhizobium sp.]|nr:hypothetical protein [Mesorhizobium sp.]
MSAGAVNLIVLVAIVLIFVSVVAVFYMAARRRDGRKVPATARQRKRFGRKVNPKTGSLFP